MIFRYRNRSINLTDHTLLMGILNVTPDSFSEQGLNFCPQTAVKNALKMVRDGADIIDVGGESTRPGADPVTAQEEIGRILPVVRELRKASGVPLSIDTYKAEVAAVALENGADIINDISGFHREPAMKDVAKKYQAGCVVMHMRGTPKTMQMNVVYDDIVTELVDYFTQTIATLSESGIGKEYICLDPGIGFSKTVDQNLFLIKNLPVFSQLGRPLLVGPSRKSFIGNVLNIENPSERRWGTAASVSCAIYGGAKIIRVHDVKEMRDVCDMTDAILCSKDGGDRP